MITKACIDAVKERMDIVEVIGAHIKLSEKGHDYVCKCPFHNERTPSFTVSPTKGIYKCFGCGKSGDAITFIIEHLGKNFPEAIAMLAGIYAIPLELEGEEIKVRPTQSKLQLSFDQIEWFKGRGITYDTLQEFRVTSGKEWMPKANNEVDVICFNYFRNDELINIKYRADNKDFRLHKGSEMIFYNLDSIKGSDAAVIVEGEVDALTVHQCGCKFVISVPNGASKGVQQNLSYLDNCWDVFEGVKQVVLMVDNDEVGRALRDELARRIGREKCLKVDWPDDVKDANEMLLKYGERAVLELIANATEYPIDGILSVSDMYEDIVSYYQNGYPDGIKIGIEGFDEYISFMAGQFTTITGIPGSGKSEFTDLIMVKAATTQGWSFGICSFENQPAALHVTKLMEKVAGKSFAFRHAPQERMNQDEFNSALQVVNNHFHFINVNQIEVTLEGILSKAKELIVRKGIKGLLIDPWNYIEHKIPTGQTETQYISECLTQIKAFALTNGIHIFIIAHPTKLKKENGRYEVPNLYSISGSAHFFNKTDNGLSIYRNFDTNEVDIYIQKIRYSWLGKIGTVSYNYNTYTRQYQYINK